MTEPRRLYFTQLPNLVDDMGLSPYAYRLYGHIKRVTGESGECTQGTRTLATACKMSTGAVSAARKELAEAGLITIQYTHNPHGGKNFITMRPVDIWEKNVSEYTPSSPSELASTHSELASSPSEIKNNTDDDDKGKDVTTSPTELDPETAEVIQMYHANIGPIIPLVSDQIPGVIKDYTLQWVKDAMLIAANNGARNWSYVLTVLQNRKAGIEPPTNGNGKNGKRAAKSEKWTEVHK